MPKFRVESSVKWRTSSHSATSGSRGGSDRRRVFESSGTGRSFGGSVPALRPDFDFSKISFIASRSWTASALGRRSRPAQPPGAAGGAMLRPRRLAVLARTVLPASGSPPLPATPQQRQRATARERSSPEHLGQPVDLGRGPLLRDRDEQ